MDRNIDGTPHAQRCIDLTSSARPGHIATLTAGVDGTAHVTCRVRGQRWPYESRGFNSLLTAADWLAFKQFDRAALPSEL
jgi:hypothetical protein